jgi:hypothetical protein
MGFEEEIEHAPVGNPGGQGSNRVVSSGSAQLLQQPTDTRRVVEVGVGGGVAGQQGPDRVAGRQRCPNMGMRTVGIRCVRRLAGVPSRERYTAVKVEQWPAGEACRLGVGDL